MSTSVTPSTQVPSIEKIKQKSLIGATSFFLRTAILQGIGLIAAILLSAFFTPQDFGIFGFVIQIVGLLTFFSDIGLAAALIQKRAEPTLADFRSAFTAQFILSLLIFALVCLILMFGFVQEKTGSAGVWILLALGASFPLATLKTIPSIILERKLEFSKVVIPQIFEQLFFYSILVYLAWNGMGALAYAYAIIVRSIVGVIVMWLIQPWSIGFGLQLEALKGLLKYGIQFQANDLLARVKDQLFFLFLGLLLPLDVFGYIQWAKNWSIYPYNLTVQNILAITFPTFSRLQHDTVLVKKAVEKSIYFISTAIFPILITMSVFALPITIIFPVYEKWQPALLSLALFNANVALSAITNPIINAINAVGKISITLKLMVLWTLLTWAVTPLLLWLFGYNGVALAAVVVALTALVVVNIGAHLFKISFWQQIFKQLIASVAMILVAQGGIAWWSLGLEWLLVGIVLSVGTYAGVLLALDYKRIIVEVLQLFKMRSAALEK